MAAPFLPRVIALAVVLSACGGRSAPSTLELRAATSDAPCAGWTAREPMCAPPLTLFEDREGTRPIAVITHPGYIAIDWSMPDDATDRAEARVLLLGFDLSGWALLSDRRFELRDAHALEPGVLRVPAGSPVRVIGRDRLGLRVELASAFRSPSIVRATIVCADLGAPTAQDAQSEARTFVGARDDRLGVRDQPDAPIGLSVELFEGAMFSLVEERGGWARVVGPETGDATLLVDGWVESSSLLREVQPSRESGCDPADDRDVCPDALIEQTTSVHVGAEPGTASRLLVRAGTEVQVVDRRDGYFAIATTMTGLTPPEGSRFWVSADALTPCDDEAVECSCPDAR